MAENTQDQSIDPDKLVFGKVDSVAIGKTATQEASKPEPLYYLPRNQGAETFKSAAIATVIGSAVTYAAAKIYLGSSPNRPWSLKPGKWDSLAAAVLGGLTGAYFGIRNGAEVSKT